MSDNNPTQPAHQTYTAEQLAMLDNSVVPTLDIHQPLPLKTQVGRCAMSSNDQPFVPLPPHGLDIHSPYGFDFNEEALDASYREYLTSHNDTANYPADYLEQLFVKQPNPKDTTMSMNITEALTEKYLDATHQFALSMVDTINETFTNDDLTACLNCENQLGVEDANSGFDLVECVVYYDLHHQRPCAKLFVNAVVGSRVLLDVYLSAWQLQYYHESISALQSLTMFNVIEANQSNF